jgi:hypothetical protein
MVGFRFWTEGMERARQMELHSSPIKTSGGRPSLPQTEISRTHLAIKDGVCIDCDAAGSQLANRCGRLSGDFPGRGKR